MNILIFLDHLLQLFNGLVLFVKPCIIFMDEIDAIGGRRFSEGTSADREIQRTLMELLNQLDGFDQLGKVYMLAQEFSSPSESVITPGFSQNTNAFG